MSLDNAIAEMRAVREAQTRRIQYEESLSSKVRHIKSILAPDQLNTWRVVETIINSVENDGFSDYEIEKIREKLKETESPEQE